MTRKQLVSVALAAVALATAVSYLLNKLGF
jgi:hypothetical protein